MYEGATIIYTDGSKSDDKVGSAFITSEQSHYWKLDRASSIFTAELYAIWQALRYVEYCQTGTFLICCDSLTALRTIKATFSFDPLIQNINETYHWLTSTGKNVIFVWTPGHVGIVGNERADEAAKLGATSENESSIPVRLEDAKIAIRQQIKNLWQSEWDHEQCQLRLIKPSVNTWEYPKMNRREQAAITRLRIGHSRITSSYILAGQQRPQCEHCGCPLDIKHIIVDCTKYTTIRVQINLPNNFMQCLNEVNISKTLLYLKRTKLLWQI
nr:unnamed protein product [Callosobruchus analis]